MKVKNIIASLTALMFVLAVSAMAAENIIEVNQVSVIHSEDMSEIHVLAKPELGFPDTTMHIDRAFLNILAAPQTDDTTFISIRVHPITTDWDVNNVGWDTPWQNPGGDIVETRYAEYMITLPELQDISIDITDLCSRWADGRIPYYGFLVTISESSLAQFTMERYGDSGPIATVSLKYRAPGIW